MHQTQFSEKIPYGGFSQIRSQLYSEAGNRFIIMYSIDRNQQHNLISNRFSIFADLEISKVILSQLLWIITMSCYLNIQYHTVLTNKYL